MRGDCGDMLDFGEHWFMCQLDADHGSDHRHHHDQQPDSYIRTHTITWPQEPQTVEADK